MVPSMLRIRRTRAPVVLVLALVIATVGCRDILQAEKSNYAILNIETVATGPTTFGAIPTGLFFNAAGVFLSSSFVSRDSCLIQAYPADITNPTLDYLDAGTGVIVKFNRPQTQGTITPRTQSGVTTYRLPDGTPAIPFVPGDTVTVEIPGGANGLSPVTATARTAEAFTPSAITLPASNQQDVNVTWTPGATTVPGAAMFYSLRYAAPATPVINREIACFFVDDGSATIPFEVLFDFRTSTLRAARATRVRIAANRIGNTATHITSTFTADITINATP
jgi:hypothetical protein